MNTRKVFSVLLIFLSLACGLVTPVSTPPAKEIAATQPPAATRPVIEETVYGEIARGHITTITEQIGARWSGTEEEKQTAQYIEGAFAEMGYAPEVKPFSRIGWVDDETDAMFNSANIIAVKDGDSQQVIVVGAHYDSSDEGLGADDNASGVGVLLELAEMLVGIPTLYTIHFVAFGSEEAGMLGSQEYVDDLDADELANTIGFINLDSVIAGDFTYVYSNESKSVLRDWSLAWAEENDLSLQTIPNVSLSEDGYGTADYDAFEKAGISFAYFESTNWTLGDEDSYTQVDPQYGDNGAIIHTRYDMLVYLDETFPGRVEERLQNLITILYNLLTQFTVEE